MDRLQAAEQLRRALQILAAALADEDATQVAYIYPEWVAGTKYKKDEFISYGVNSLGDPQLYRVLKTHKADSTPDVDTTNYKAVGISSSGYPEWTQPLSNKDAYNKGDIVDRNGTLYISLKNNNRDDPEDNTGKWEVYTEA